jgi:hypothetical protein
MMDAAVIVLGWAVMGLLLFGFIGEFIITPWRQERERKEKGRSAPTDRPDSCRIQITSRTAADT